MLLYFNICIIIISFIYFYFKRTFEYWEHRNIKGPKPIAFFGNYKDVALRKKHPGVFFYDVYKQYPEEQVIGLYRMTRPTLLIRDLDIVKQVMVKDFLSFQDRGVYYSKHGLTDNMFHCDAQTWKLIRNKFSAVFTPSKLKNLLPIFIDYGAKLTNSIENITLKKSEQQVYRLVLKYTASTAMAAILGMKINTFNIENTFYEITDDMVWTNHFTELDMLIPGCLVKLDVSLFHKKIVKYFHEIIKTALKRLPNANTNPCIVMDVIMNLQFEQESDNKDQSFLETNALMAAQAWIFYLATYLNNALTLTNAMYYLARNSDVQNKLIKEIDEIMKKYEHKLTYEAIKEMKYIDMIFEETLRMHPLTNSLVRSAPHSVKLDGLDLTIDAGTVVVISPYAIQHDEKYYPEPESFNPERFLPENFQNRHVLSFLSFGAGPRSCIGAQLARLQFSVGLALLFTKFRVEPTENTVSEIKYDPWRLLMTPQDKIILNIIRR